MNLLRPMHLSRSKCNLQSKYIASHMILVAGSAACSKVGCSTFWSGTAANTVIHAKASSRTSTLQMIPELSRNRHCSFQRALQCLYTRHFFSGVGNAGRGLQVQPIDELPKDHLSRTVHRYSQMCSQQFTGPFWSFIAVTTSFFRRCRL